MYKKKEPLTIDFITEEEISDKDLFAPLKRGKPTIELDHSKKHLLPEDTRLTTRDLYRCFLKPDFMLMRREGMRLKPLTGENHNDDVPVAVADHNEVVFALGGDDAEVPVVEQRMY